MYVELIEEFQRLRKTGLKFSTALLGTLARDIIKSDEGVFNADFRDADGKLILDRITTRWVQTFMAKHNCYVAQRKNFMLIRPSRITWANYSEDFHLASWMKT